MGLKGVLLKLIPRMTRGYEDAFDKALMDAVGPADVVWDVGANVGYYTIKIAQKIGEGGLVCAFEPFPETFSELKARIDASNLTNVNAYPLALGSHATVMHVPATDGAASRTNTLAHSSKHFGEMTPDGSLAIQVRRGDELIRDDVPRPNVCKIDVEAYEEDVLFGMREMLVHPELRAVFCEVHFSQLQARGFLRAPLRIESLLQDAGFKTQWLDESHLGAFRR